MDATQINPSLSKITEIITAVGGLGTAAFGLLEALKPVCPFINRIGFKGIKATAASLTPAETPADPKAEGKSPKNALPSAKVIDSLQSNWINGTDLASQKAIAKSLIKLHLSAGNALALADATNVDGQTLKDVATSIVAGKALTQPQSDAYSRFDLIVTAILDECYQKADQIYRNWTRGLAALIAVILAETGGYLLHTTDPNKLYIFSTDFGLALLVGLLATPLAPIAKDLSTALATAVNTMQMVKKP